MKWSSFGPHWSTKSSLQFVQLVRHEHEKKKCDNFCNGPASGKPTLPCKGGAGGQIPNKVCNFCQYPAGGLRGTGGKVSDKHCLNSFVVSLSFESPHFEFINAALGPH